jgi:hypothetical protein
MDSTVDHVGLTGARENPVAVRLCPHNLKNEPTDLLKLKILSAARE